MNNEYGAGQQPGRLWLRNELAAENSATTQASGDPGANEYGAGQQPGRLWLRNNLATDSQTTADESTIAPVSRPQSRTSNYAGGKGKRGQPNVGLTAIKERRGETDENAEDDDTEVSYEDGQAGFLGKFGAGKGKKKKRKEWLTPPPTTGTVAKRLENLTLRIFAWSTLIVHAVAVSLWILFFNALVDWTKEKPGLRPTPRARNEASIFFALIEGTLFVSGSIALIRRVRPLAMLTIILLITCTSTMNVFWADLRLRLISLGIVFITVVCASTMTWFSEDIQHEENTELTQQIREIEKDPRKNRDLIYEIEAAQSRNVVFFALLTTFMAEAAFIVGIAMIVLSLLVKFPIFPLDHIMTTHLRVAGIILTVGSLIGAFGAYTKRRTFLLMSMILAITAALSASNLGADTAMLRNWLSEVQKFCKNGQLRGTDAKSCNKQNTLAIATSAVNYMCWITSVVLSWGCWMLEEFIQDWEEAESKNVDRNLSDEFDLIPGLITIVDPIAFYLKVFASLGFINSCCAVGMLVVSRIPGSSEEDRWRVYTVILGACLLITYGFQFAAFLKKKGRLPLTLAFFMTTWITGFCIHMAYIGFSMYRYGAQTGYGIQPARVEGKEILYVLPRIYFNDQQPDVGRRIRIRWALALTILTTIFSVLNMYFIIMCSEAIQDRDEERPSLPKRRRTNNAWDDGFVGRLRSTVSQFSQFFGRKPSGMTPRGGNDDDYGPNGRSFFSNWGKSFTKSFAANRRAGRQGPGEQVAPTMPSYLAAALQDDNAQGIVLGPSEKSFLARTLGLKGKKPAPQQAVPQFKPPQRQDSDDSFKSFTKTPRAMKRSDMVEEEPKKRVGFITRMLSKKGSSKKGFESVQATEDFDALEPRPGHAVPAPIQEDEIYTAGYPMGAGAPMYVNQPGGIAGPSFKFGGPAPQQAPAMLGGMSFRQYDPELDASGMMMAPGGPVSPYQLPTPQGAMDPHSHPVHEEEVPPMVKHTSIAKVMGWMNHVPSETADPIPTPIGSDAGDQEEQGADFPDYASIASGVSHAQSMAASQRLGGNPLSLAGLRPGAHPGSQAQGSVKNFKIQKLNLDD